MSDKNKMKSFENKKIRTAWDEIEENWCFSIVDVIAVLTDSKNPQTYWRVMKKRLKDEGNESGGWENANDRCCRYAATFAYHSINSIT